MSATGVFVVMQKELFDQPAASSKEASRKRRIAPVAGAINSRHELREPNVAKLRKSVGLSQARFAAALGISVATLQNWEQRRRRPDGPARVLLNVFKRHPKIVAESVAAAKR